MNVKVHIGMVFDDDWQEWKQNPQSLTLGGYLGYVLKERKRQQREAGVLCNFAFFHCFSCPNSTGLAGSQVLRLWVKSRSNSTSILPIQSLLLVCHGLPRMPASLPRPNCSHTSQGPWWVTDTSQASGVWREEASRGDWIWGDMSGLDLPAYPLISCTNLLPFSSIVLQIQCLPSFLSQLWIVDCHDPGQKRKSLQSSSTTANSHWLFSSETLTWICWSFSILTYTVQ